MMLANIPRWLIGIGGGLSLTSLVLFVILSLAQRVEQGPALCPTVHCFIIPHRIYVFGFEVAPGTYQLLLAFPPVFAAFGVLLILAGLMLRGGKER